VLTSTADANIGSIMGIGFPPWTGGSARTAELQKLECPRQDSNLRHRLLNSSLLARARTFLLCGTELRDCLRQMLDDSGSIPFNISPYSMNKRWRNFELCRDANDQVGSAAVAVSTAISRR
jgi:hypothetical protein